MIVWITGLPGTGKTTLAKEFVRLNPGLKWLDGDVFREACGNDLGYTENDRTVNMDRVAYVLKHQVLNGFNTVCSFVSSAKKHRDIIREVATDGFIEIFLDVPPRIKHPYENPVSPDYHFTKYEDMKAWKL